MSKNKAKIAVVNDDTEFLEMMNMLLTEEGYDIILWKVGNTAYDMLRKEQPDLIILDIRLEHPEAGWHVLEMLTLDPDTRDIPIIVSSADNRALEAKKEQLTKYGIDTLEKPFDLDDLLTKVTQIVGRST